MLRTEKEARKTWCPFARARIGQISQGPNTEAVIIGNRDLDSGMADWRATCLASACMAWRVGVEGQTRSHKEPAPGWEYDEETELYYEPDASARQRDRGFCGLAGKVGS